MYSGSVNGHRLHAHGMSEDGCSIANGRSRLAEHTNADGFDRGSRVAPPVDRTRGFAFDSWTPGKGISRGYTYRRIDDAHCARNVESKFRKNSIPTVWKPAAQSVNSLNQSIQVDKMVVSPLHPLELRLAWKLQFARQAG